MVFVKVINKWKIPVLLFLVMLTGAAAVSQTKDELERKKKLIQKDIEYKNKILKQTRKHQQLSSIQLVMLEKKITSRRQLISNINAQIKITNSKIDENRSLIESLQKDLKELKQDYAKMIYYSFRNKSAYNKLMFVFSSEDFNQAYKRLKYLQQYALYRRKQAEMILKTQQMLSNKIKKLEQSRREKERLLGIEHKEKELLSDEITDQRNTFAKLKNKEKALKKEIERNKQKTRQLQKAIEKIIEEELKSKGDNFFALTPEAKQLSKSFASNKGNLPWPVLKGFITEYFGEHPHPVLKQVTIKNNGINISTTVGSYARAVFNGVVSGIVILQGAGKVVMVRHGEYISIYSNLETADVVKGQKVSVKQNIGKILTDTASGRTYLHFELWKGKTILNPSPWLYRHH